MNSRRAPDALAWAAVWVWVSTFVVASGWVLSAVGGLNRAGYGAVLAIGLGIAASWGWRERERVWPLVRWRRYRRLWPALFLVACTFAIVGAVAHAPNNIDAVAYRLPRIMHWLAEERWHWIDTVDPRLNYSAPVQEWLMAPGLSFFASARWSWVPSAVSFGLLPGLFFVVFRGCGVSARVAARWMWLLPLAPVYLLQAGSIANDLLGATYFVAALAFAFRARIDEPPRWLLASVFAMALATGVKTSNLPLALPWLIAVWPALRRSAAAVRWRGAWVLVPVFFVSGVFTLCLNFRATGDWTGDPADLTKVRAGGWTSGLVGNTIETALQNLSPPVLPIATPLERWLVDRVEAPLRARFGADFPRFSVHLTEVAQEEWAALGGATVLLLLLGLGGKRARVRLPHRQSQFALWIGTGVAWLVFFVTMGSEMAGRLLAAYYPLAMAWVLAATTQELWVNARVFTVCAVLAAAVNLFPLVVSPSRPLVSRAWLLRLAHVVESFEPGVVRHAETLYKVYAERSDPLAVVRTALPADVKRIGFMATGDDSEWSFWQPLGARRVVTVSPGESAHELRARGLEWIAVRADAVWPDVQAFDAWLRSRDADIVSAVQARTKARRAPEDWRLIRLRRADSDADR